MKKIKIFLSGCAFTFALSGIFATHVSSASLESSLTHVAPYGSCLQTVGTCDNHPLPFACTDLLGNILYEEYANVCITQARGNFMPY
ncbi:hypothetical protein QQ020_07855 [Fulvivirgaceae bacterium BMA12]|uniref:Kazal-like domain-containing protein n=1 Tax=Agaribacillus aureus TaxID=3051825 RepID=A0ABT8L4K0_9BACT|nr:hypothetical protein [Fulvivirgaceae bacterium BMA12]